jgi:heptosyltransferase-3
MNPQNVIIIRPDRLGDLVLSLPVARAIKEKYPACQISYLAAPGPGLIAPMVDYVNSWIIDKGQNGRLTIFELANRLSQGGYDLLIELKPSWRTAVAGFLSRIPIRIGTGRRFYSFLYNRRLNLHRRDSGRHQTDLDLAMLQPLRIDPANPLPCLTLPEGFKKDSAKLVGESINEYIVIHPGSGGSAPNWPIENYKELAQLLLRETDVIITGLEAETNGFEGCLNLTGRTSLPQLAGILGGARAFVSGSTGPLHLADALGIPCISFFVNHAVMGPVRWGPRRNQRNVIIPDAPSCRCRNISECHCLEQVSPREAFNKVRMVLNPEIDGAAIES